MAASYCSATLAEIRPRLLTVMRSSFAHARISALRSRLDAVRPGRPRCPRPARRACSMNGAIFPRNAAAFFFAQVYLVVSAAEPEPRRLIRWASVRNLWTASPPLVYREGQRAERVARQVACKMFDQMAGELKA